VNANNIIQQIRGMKGLVLEGNRTTIAIRFRDLITESLKAAGESTSGYMKWVENDAKLFIKACDLTHPPTRTDVDMSAPATLLAQFVDKWAAVDSVKVDDGEFQQMSQETFNVKSSLLQELKAVIDAGGPD